MALKDIIQNYMNKNHEFKRNFVNEQQNRKIQRVLDERTKNSNERELERYIEEDRQRKIKIALEKYRKERQREYWKPTSINKGWDTLKGKSIMKQKKLFTGGNGKASILKGNFHNKVK